MRLLPPVILTVLCVCVCIPLRALKTTLILQGTGLGISLLQHSRKYPSMQPELQGKADSPWGEGLQHQPHVLFSEGIRGRPVAGAIP